MNKVIKNGARGVIALVVVSLAALGTVAATDKDGGTATVVAQMKDATPLRDGNKVRAAGVEVGQVDSVTLGPDNFALVTMTVDRSVLPLHQDATATVVPQDLLGERLVTLDQGSAASPAMNEPYVIPIGQTKNAVELSQVVDMVDDPAGTGLAMMLTTLGEGIGKNPQETHDAIAALKPAMTQTKELAQVLSDQNQVLSRLVQNAQPVAGAVATRNGESWDKLIGTATRTLEVTAQNRQQLNDSLQRLPGTLQSAQQTLAEVAGVSPPTTQTLKELRPLTDDLTDLSQELRAFSDSADPTLASLRPVLDKGRDMLDELRPVADDLARGSGGLKDTFDGYHGLAKDALSARLVDLMEFAKGWTLSISDYDAISHYFKAVTPYTPKTGGATVAGPIPGGPDDPTPNLPLPRGGRAPIPFGDAPNAPHEGGPYLPQPPGGKTGTGMSSKQENNMMDQLLGGG